MSKPMDPTTGVKSFSIGGRMVELRQRCLGMTDEERRWRAQFLKDQVLSPREPRDVPEYYKDTTNVFRRLWKTPMWKFECLLRPIVGKEWAGNIRRTIGFTTWIMIFTYVGLYHFKYVANDWTRINGIEWYMTRTRMYPGDPGYPNFYENKPQDYADFGFSSSPLAGKVQNPPSVPSPPLNMEK